MKKSLSLLVAIAMVFSMFATLVSAAETTQSAGQKLQELGVIKGTANGLDEDKEWKRQDITILLARLLQVENEAKNYANTHGFTDVNTKSYNGYISWAKEKGYFTGESATVFGINKSITNQQFAAVLLRVLKVDVDYANAFEKAVELKLVSADLKATDTAIRGDIYESLLTALDYKIDGKKLGTILGLKGYEVADLALEKASAVVANSVTLTFNTKVSTLANEDVEIVDADGHEVLVEKVTIKDEVATVALSSALTSGKEYTVTVAKATPVEGEALANATAKFTYKKAAIASVAIKNTTVAVNQTVELLVKDEAGNDISADFSADNFVVNSSDVVKVNTNLKALAAGMAVVNVSLEDTEITTGNVVITVKDALSIAVDSVTLNNGGSVVKPENLEVGKTYTVNATFKDQDGDPVTPVASDITIVSRNPAIVSADSNLKELKAVQTGSATIIVTGKYAGNTVSKTIVVTVKNTPVYTSFDVSASTINVVAGTDLDAVLTVTFKDQYGNAINAGKNVTATLGANAPVTIDGGTAVTNGVKFTISPTTTTGSTTLTVNVEGKTKKVTVRTVAKGAENGYIVETNNGTTIDFDRHTTDSSKRLGETTSTVVVYVKDTNGNKVRELLPSDVRLERTVDTINSILVINDTEVTANSVGTEKVNVKVNGVVVGSVTFKAVASSENAVASVKQLKTSISASYNNDNDVLSKIYGGAFKAYNSYGDEVTIAAPYKILSSNTSVVDNSGNIIAAGKVVLTIEIEHKFYTLNVNVN